MGVIRHLLNAQNIGGYFYDEDTKTLPVFINYDKADDAITYEDRFVSENQLIVLSKHPRKVTSKDVVHTYKSREADRDENNRRSGSKVAFAGRIR